MFLWWWKLQLGGRDRQKAIAKIAGYRSEAALNILVSILLSKGESATDRHHDRKVAAVALGRSGDRRAIIALVEALTTDWFELHLVASEALNCLDPQWPRSPEGLVSVPRLIQGIVAARQRSGTELQICRIAEFLVQAGDPQTLPLFLSIVKSGDNLDPRPFAAGLAKWATPAQTVDAVLAWLRQRGYRIDTFGSCYLDLLSGLSDRRLIAAAVLVWARARKKLMWDWYLQPGRINSETVNSDKLVTWARALLERIDVEWPNSPEVRATLPTLLDDFVQLSLTGDPARDHPIRGLLSRIDPDWLLSPTLQRRLGETVLKNVIHVLACTGFISEAVSAAWRSEGVVRLVEIATDAAAPRHLRMTVLRHLTWDALATNHEARSQLQTCVLKMLGDLSMNEAACQLLMGVTISGNDISLLVQAINQFMSRSGSIIQDHGNKPIETTIWLLQHVALTIPKLDPDSLTKAPLEALAALGDEFTFRYGIDWEDSEGRRTHHEYTAPLNLSPITRWARFRLFRWELDKQKRC